MIAMPDSYSGFSIRHNEDCRISESADELSTTFVV
jgi:hypothetical protein